MDFLDSITSKEKEKLASLPFRVGLKVSVSDETGGFEADAEEIQVLSNIIEGFSQEVVGSEVVQQIMKETLAQRSLWTKWADEMDTVENDCRHAVELFRERGLDKDLKAYSAQIMEIAEAVAAAFSEYEYKSFWHKAKIYVSYHYYKAIKKHALASRKTLKDFLAISEHERRILSEIAEALGSSRL